MNRLLLKGKDILEDSIVKSSLDKTESAAYRHFFRKKQDLSGGDNEKLKDLWAILHTRSQQERYLVSTFIIPAYNKYIDVSAPEIIKKKFIPIEDDRKSLNRYIQMYNAMNKRVYVMHSTAKEIQKMAKRKGLDDLFDDISSSIVLFDKAVIDCVSTNYVFLKRFIDKSFSMTVSGAKKKILNDHRDLYVEEIL